jgi:crotonobetainyl-CoA:carnitine CoA-transferase CaiB-like acyl-CoA transferase
LGIEGIENDARFANHELQVKNKTAMQDLFRARFKTNTTAHWLGKLEEQDLLCAPVMTLAQALADEQTAVNGMIWETQGEVEMVRVVGSPIHLSDAQVGIRIAPAQLGQHTDAVRAEMAARNVGAAE